MRRKQPNKIKKIVSNLVTVVCLVVFAISIYALGGIGLDYYHNHKVLAEVQDIYDTFEQEEKLTNDGQIRPQFKALHDINPDIVGWISIDDTKIDYPILQAENNEYYLDRNYKHEESRAGSVFMDYRNGVAFGNRNMILYGHNMKDGSMFRHLNKFLDEDFYQHHPEIYVDTLYDRFDAEVFSVYYTTTAFDYIQTDFASEEEYEVFLNDIKTKSNYPSTVEVSETDWIVTLSTCDYTLDPDEGRLVVHAKLIEKE